MTEGRTSYQVIVLPASRYVPLETMLQILELARAGATVVSLESWPGDVSGLADLDARRARFKSAVAAVSFRAADSEGTREAAIGRGRVLQGNDLGRLLARAGVRREPMVDHGLQFARRADALGRMYFVSNPGDRAVDGWVPLDSRTAPLIGFDAMDGRFGNLAVRASGTGREVYLQIPVGGSLIVAESPAPASSSFQSYRAAGEPVTVRGPWTVRFVKGGPRLPPQRTVDRLVSWTTFGQDAEVFSGTASYVATFARPTSGGQQWQLDLGQVAESARVRLNGRDLATLIAPPYRVVVDSAQFNATNTVEVSVTNLSANRIRDLDLRGVPWKKFYNVNFPARLPENREADGLFSAAHWTPLESGLIGPVTLTPLIPVK
jgi:alpha-L-rhamnosidase